MPDSSKPPFADGITFVTPLDATELVDERDSECAAGGRRTIRDGGTSCFCGEITEESATERVVD